MTACKYRADKDKASGQQKIVFMLSTCHQPAMESIPGKNAQNPKVIRDYNIHMEGVDCVDQQLHGFHTLRKSYKWYKKLAFKLMMQMTLNAHKVFQKSTESTMNFLSFIHEIIATLSKNVNLYLMIHFTIIWSTFHIGQESPTRSKRPTPYKKM